MLHSSVSWSDGKFSLPFLDIYKYFYIYVEFTFFMLFAFGQPRAMLSYVVSFCYFNNFTFKM